MNTRRIAPLTSLILALSLPLAACGGAPSAGQPSGGSAQEQTEPAVDPAEKFQGTWKLAAAEMNGVTMSGNFKNMFGTEDGWTISIAADGTGTMAMGEEESPISWKLKNDTTIEVTPAGENSSGESLSVAYDEENASIHFSMADEEYTGTLTFTADGKLEGLSEVDLAKATAITSLDQAVGDWKLCGFGMSGTYAFGEASSLESFTGGSFSSSMSIDANGAAKLGDEDSGTVELKDTGAVLNDGYMLAELKLLDDKLIVDMSAIMGSETFLMYSK